MTDSAGPPDAPPRRLDDPAWVDDIVASAVARVTGNGAGDPVTATVTEESAGEASSPPAPVENPSPTRTAAPKNGIPKPSAPGKRIVARPRKPVAAGTVTAPPPRTPSTREPSADVGRAPRSLPPSLAVARAPEVEAPRRNGNGSAPSRVPTAAATVVSPATTLVAEPAPAVVLEPAEQNILGERFETDAETESVVEAVDDHHAGRARGLLEWLVVIGGALLVAILIKTFLFQAFYIPSGSMLPTLQIDDRVLVNKLSYDLHDVNRGDLVVFERPEDGDPTAIDDLIKRVIGLPGDSVEVRDSVVYVNGGALDEPYLPAGIDFGDSPPVVVPDDHVFVMGDNRTNSRDSRVFGPVPVDDIVGRAFFRIWPLTNLGFL